MSPVIELVVGYNEPKARIDDDERHRQSPLPARRNRDILQRKEFINIWDDLMVYYMDPCLFIAQIYVHRMNPLTSLSGLPSELLDIILFYLTTDRYGYRNARRAYPFLLSNKAICSRAVKLLYQVVDWSFLRRGRSAQVLKTLIASTRGTTSIPYHQNIQEFALDIDRWEQEKNALQELLDSVLISGNLRKLNTDFEDSLQFSLEANLTRLAHLSISGLLSTSLRDWLLKMLPKMPLEGLCIDFSDTDLPWNSFTLQENTLKTLEANGRLALSPSNPNFRRDTGFLGTFVATQWHSLTSLRCYSLLFAVDQAFHLPNLRNLELHNCHLKGWETLCNSFTRLKRLKLIWTVFVGIQTKDILSTLPPRVRGTLESLAVQLNHVIGDVDASWFSAPASSFTSLREFATNQISVETLASLLAHCPSLENLLHSGHRYQPETFLTDAHLKILSERPPLNLLTVSLFVGNFSSEGLANFVKSCPASLRCLKLDGCSGLTPSILHAMFQLPLRKLSLLSMTVREKDYQELEQISEMRKTLKSEFYYSYRRA